MILLYKFIEKLVDFGLIIDFDEKLGIDKTEGVFGGSIDIFRPNITIGKFFLPELID